MKATARVYKGIEFINESDLPTNQQLLLQHNEEVERIKILLDGKIVKNCIQFREYERWYSSVYKKSVAKPGKEEALQLKVSLSKV